MKTFDSISEAREGILAYQIDHAAGLPEETRTELRRLSSSPSPVDQIVGVMELLYARRDTLNDEGKDLVGGLAAYATVNGWHGLQEDSRGDMIVQSVRRDLGEKAPAGIKFQKAEEDPEAKSQYVAPVEVAPVPDAEPEPA